MGKSGRQKQWSLQGLNTKLQITRITPITLTPSYYQEKQRVLIFKRESILQS